MAASPGQLNAVASPAVSDHSLRVGQVYLDVQRQILHCLNDTAHQLWGEGVPFVSADLARQSLQTTEGQPVGPDDLPLLRAWREERPLEAQFVQLLAGAVSAGLTRMEKEADAARARVQFEQFFSPELARALEYLALRLVAEQLEQELQ